MASPASPAFVEPHVARARAAAESWAWRGRVSTIERLVVDSADRVRVRAACRRSLIGMLRRIPRSDVNVTG